MWPNLQETADLVTFTEKIFNGKLHFLCSVWNLEPRGIISETAYNTIRSRMDEIKLVENSL